MLKICLALIALLAYSDAGTTVYKITMPLSMFEGVKSSGGLAEVTELNTVLDGGGNVVLSVYNKADYDIALKAINAASKNYGTFKIILSDSAFKYFNDKGAFNGLVFEQEDAGDNMNVVFNDKEAYEIAKERLDAIQKAGNVTVYKLTLTLEAYEYFQKQGVFKDINGNGEVETDDKEVIISFEDKDVYEAVLATMQKIQQAAAESQTIVSEYKIQLSKKLFNAFNQKGVFAGFDLKTQKAGKQTVLVFTDKAKYEAVLKVLQDAGATLNSNEKVKEKKKTKKTKKVKKPKKEKKKKVKKQKKPKKEKKIKYFFLANVT